MFGKSNNDDSDSDDTNEDPYSSSPDSETERTVVAAADPSDEFLEQYESLPKTDQMVQARTFHHEPDMSAMEGYTWYCGTRKSTFGTYLDTNTEPPRLLNLVKVTRLTGIGHPPNNVTLHFETQAGETVTYDNSTTDEITELEHSRP